MNFLINIPVETENLDEILSEVQLIEGVEKQTLYGIGASDYISLIVPITVAFMELIPTIFLKIFEQKNVVVKIKGLVLKGTPEDIIEKIRQMPECIEAMKQIACDSTDVSVEGKAKNVLKVYEEVKKI